MTLIRFPVVQYAYVVDDLEAACMRWVRAVGAGPFFVTTLHHVKQHFHRGKPSEAEVSFAFGQAGPAHVQLIQQHNDAPSVYRDFFPKGTQGFHHICILVPDFVAEKQRFEAAGYPAVTELVSAARVAYMDARSDLGFFVELYEDNPLVRERFASWKASHENWDGKDPIRQM